MSRRWMDYDFVCSCGRQHLIRLGVTFVVCSHCGEAWRFAEFCSLDSDWEIAKPYEGDRALRSGALAR